MQARSSDRERRRPARLRTERRRAPQLARDTRLCLGGAGAAKTRLDIDLLILTGNPVEEAERMRQLARP